MRRGRGGLARCGLPLERVQDAGPGGGHDDVEEQAVAGDSEREGEERAALRLGRCQLGRLARDPPVPSQPQPEPSGLGPFRAEHRVAEKGGELGGPQRPLGRRQGAVSGRPGLARRRHAIPAVVMLISVIEAGPTPRVGAGRTLAL
jgi:hypothetical protein